MTDINDVMDAAYERPRPAPGGFPSAGERLIRKGLISAEGFGQAFMAETADWDAIMTMDEAALDAELGPEEVEAVNAVAREGRRRIPDPSQPPAPRLTLVGGDEADGDPPPFTEHHRLRLAGVRDGLVVGRQEIERELRDVRRLLMASQGGHLTDVFRNLQAYLEDGRLLLVERIDHGVATLEACLAYELVTLACAGGVDDWIVRQRVAVVRLLAVRDEGDRARLAERLCLEAQLRATVRAMHDGGPHIRGMLGIVPVANTRAIRWADAFGERVQTVPCDARAAANDQTLEALRDWILEGRIDAVGRGTPYSFVIANRTRLIEAGRLHLAAVTNWDVRGDQSGLRFDYDTDDPWSPQIAAAAETLCAREAGAFDQLGLLGESDATLWGPSSTPQMSVAVSPPDNVCNVNLRAEAAA